MQLAPFALEQFYERWEFRARLMLSSSDCEAHAVGDLLALEPDAGERLMRLRLGYTEVPGSQELRTAIASSYEGIDAADVLTLAAAEEGIFLVYHALLGAGDHVVVETPGYGSALELARSTGASVSSWPRRFEDGWEHDVDALQRLVGTRTRLIYINTPHNPTGLQMRADVYARVLELAAERGAVVLSDEVYRGLEHAADDRRAPACERYEHAVSLGAVSKAHGLPGLRIGWLASRDAALLQRVKALKLYTTICSSAPSELLVALAMRHAERLVSTSRKLLLANLPLLDAFLQRRAELLQWVRPTAGPIGFARVRGPRDVYSWCQRIAAEASVLLLPGAVYGEPSHVRLGFGRADLPSALQTLDEYLG